MTKEQAVKWLKAYIQETPFQMEQYERAFEMAISALNSLEEVYAEGYNDGFMQAEVNYENDKALSQKPKTGHWKRISMDKYTTHAQYWYECDKCGEHNLGNTDYCPSCGCRMESEVRNDIQRNSKDRDKKSLY